jgi:hypothetical protein
MRFVASLNLWTAFYTASKNITRYLVLLITVRYAVNAKLSLVHNCDLITDFMHGCSRVPCKNSGQRVSRVMPYIQVHVHTITCHERTEGEHRYSCTLSLTSALEGGWSRPRAGSFIPRTEPVLFVERLGGPQGQSGRVSKIWLPPDFETRSVQPGASRCIHTHI